MLKRLVFVTSEQFGQRDRCCASYQ